VSKERIKVAVVGAGHWGRNLVRVFFGLKTLDTVCDFNRDILKEIKKLYGNINYTSSYSKVLNNNSIKAVVISTPAESHYRLAKEALNFNKDVFVEKPLAMAVDEGAELVELAKRKDRILMVGHLLEYHPGILKLKELIDKQRLGKINYIYSSRLNLGRIRKEENILWSFAPHDISVILRLMNKMPESVSALGGNYLHKDIADVTVSNFSFKGGTKGHIFVSWLHPYKEQKLIVIGNKKMAVFDDVIAKDKLVLYNYKVDLNGKMPTYWRENAEPVEFKHEEPLLLECKHFLRCIAKRKKPKTDGQSALKILRILEACEFSLQNGGSIMTLNDYYAHPTSTIDHPCRIGKGTKIWHYSHIMRNATVGEKCNIGQNVFIGSKTSIGNNVKIQNNVSIYDSTKLEDDVFCGPSVVFTNVINPRSHIIRKDEYRQTRVKKGATLGANATIICGVTIGEHAFIGAGAVVTKDIPAYALAYGNPATLHGWMCICGTKLQFNQNNIAGCAVCGRKYLFSDKKSRIYIKK